MIINTFLKNKFKYEKIEPYLNINLIIVSFISCISCYYNLYYSNTVKILYFYFVIETFFIPYEKIDILLHHILSISSIQYMFYYNIDMNNNYYSLKQLLLTETSSIFLGLNKLVTIFKDKINTFFLHMINALFLISFFKYRIIDYTNNIITNIYFFESIGTTNFQRSWQYITIISLYLINIYWGILITKVLFKPFIKNVKPYIFEYCLQYSYMINPFITFISYIKQLDTSLIFYYYTYIYLDVLSNIFLAYSSYYFHNYLYLKIKKKEDYNLSNTIYKDKLLLDLFAIHLRGSVQIYINLKMHNIYDYYCYYFYLYNLISCFILINVNTIFSYLILYKKKYYIENKKDLLQNILSLMFSIPPIYGIMFSSIDTDTQSKIITFIYCYLIIVIMYIKPLYGASHLLFHILMYFVNNQLVKNNIQLVI